LVIILFNQTLKKYRIAVFFFKFLSISLIDKECELHQGTKIYDNWRNPPLPLKISFYLFEITDEEFLNGTKIPSVRERGPFVYQ
jgi:hypothetical protein